MTNREAIKILEMQLKCIEYDSCDCDCKACLYGMATETEDAEALKLAIFALEKQEPMKPEKIEPCNNGLRFGWCPKCGFSQVCETANYCKTCGQALNWEEDAE